MPLLLQTSRRRRLSGGDAGISEYLTYSSLMKGGILCPLANPETLKNMPMRNFEEAAYGNGHVFNIFCKHTQISTPGPHGARTVGIWVGIWGILPNYFEKSVRFHWHAFQTCT